VPDRVAALQSPRLGAWCSLFAMKALSLAVAAVTAAGLGGVASAGPPELPICPPYCSPSDSPVARYAPKGHPSLTRPEPGVASADANNYLYAAAVQFASSTGAGATLVQADPALAAGDAHSLAEISVESADQRQIVEIGWTIDPMVNGDLAPHLFAFHWVDGQQTCYNACGWVQVSPGKRPGMRVVPGEAHRYEIENVNGDWWLLYDGEGLGYFPQSLWGGRFAQAGVAQWFGEVVAVTTSPCTQMGTGKPGDDAASASFDAVHLFVAGASVPAVAGTGAVTNPQLYSLGRATATSFGFGGPGAAAGCCTPSTCQAQQAECGSIADPVCAGTALACGSCAGTDVCSADHKCPAGYGPRDDGAPFDAPPPGAGSGGCCDAGRSGPGALMLAALVGLRLRRRRIFPG
jgi:hypothetical protein